MGIFLTVAGGVLVFFPIHRTLVWWFWGNAIFFIAAVFLELLPAKWMGLPEEWRFLLRGISRAIPEFTGPASISADPQNSLFWFLVLTSSVLTGLYCLVCSLTPRQLKNMALLASLGCSLYAVVAIISWTTGWSYPFFTRASGLQPAFGFFPNRNHTAGFLLTGTILSLGLMRYEIGRKKIIVALLATSSFVLLTGSLLFFSISRGGLLFLLAGVIIWTIGLGRHRSPMMVVFGGLLVVMMAILFVHSGSGLVERLKGGGDKADANPAALASGYSIGKFLADERISIQRDTLSMIFDHPVAGTGLGTYALVYPLYADKSLRGDATAVHAESDLLTFCAEAGIPATLIALFGLGMLSARIPGMASSSGGEWPVRWAFISAFFAELLHGLVDVPLHRPELGWWIMLLGGVGFSGSAVSGGNHSVALYFQRAVFFGGGLAMIFLGGLLIRAEWWCGAALPPFAPETVRARIVNLSFKGDEASGREAIAECESAISSHPLYHLFYYQMALLFLQFRKDIHAAATSFEVERRLSPHDPAFVFEQGKVFEDADPEAAAAIWNEALRRQLSLDHHPENPIPRATDLYQSMISAAKAHQALFERFPLAAASSTPKLRMVWYECPECDTASIAAAVRDASIMKMLDARQQGRLIDLWWQRHGERSEIEDFLGRHPEYTRAAAATKASLLASSGHAKEACFFLIKAFHLQMPEIDATRLQAADQDVPDDPLDAARYYIERGNNLAARRLLAEALNSGVGNKDKVQALFLSGVVEMRVENWDAALSCLMSFLRATGQL